MPKHSDPDFDRLRRELHEAREVNLRWKARYAERRRRILDPDVVRRMLPARLVTARAMAESLEARARHERMRAASGAYRDATDGGPRETPHMLRTAVDGLTWWVATPRPEAHEANARMLAKQTFPYRAMTQARDGALGGIMLDLGANIGATSVPRVVAGDFAAIYCAEPDTQNYDCLVRNVVDNGLIGLVLPDRVAITDTPGPVRLYRGKHSGGHTIVPDVGSAFLAHRSAEREGGSRPDDTDEVDGIPLDAWVDRLGIDLRLVTFVKVDTQGAEPQVLAGAARVLACRHIAWQLEVSPDLLEAAGSSVRDLLLQLRASFTHFIDLSGRAPGDRVRRMEDAPEALAYLTAPGHTDVLVFRAGDT